MPAPPNLQARLDQIRGAVRALPQVAERELVDLSAQSQARQVGPDGKPWARVQGRNFDPSNHIRYEPFRDGDMVGMQSSHPAARFTRFGTRHMQARPKVPGAGGLGWWAQPMILAFRGVLARGA